MLTGKRWSMAAWGTSCIVAALIVGCSDEETGTGPTPTTRSLFIAESDFQSGLLEALDMETNTMTSFSLEIASDAVVRSYGGAVYVLERYGADNVMKIDPSKTGAAAVIYQKHLGDNWNPADIEFLNSSKAYVTNMNVPHVTILDPTNGTPTGRIDISDYTFNPDSNASPYANQMVLVGPNLYVMLQRRNGFQPGGPTIVLTINTQTDAITDADTCQYGNGYDMVYANGALYVSNPGSAFVTGDGAVEKLDPVTNTRSTVITESVLGGNPNQLAHIGGQRFYVQVYVGWQDVKVVEIDASTGTVVATLPGITDAFGGICYDSETGTLYVGERAAGAAGILVFKNNVLVTGPVKSTASLPPTSMAVVK